MDSLALKFARLQKLETALKGLEYLIAKRVEAVPLPGNVSSADSEARSKEFPKYGYLSSVGKSMTLAIALARELRGAENAGRIQREMLNHDLDGLIINLTKLRQAVDRLGIPYDFYAKEAVHLFGDDKIAKIPPTMRQLMAPQVLARVEERWGDSAIRYAYDPRMKSWDRSFRTKRNRGSVEHVAMLEYIAQRVSDAAANGVDPEQELRLFLGDYIAEAEAMRRFGVELVDRALSIED